MATNKITSNFDRDIYSLLGSITLLASNIAFNFLPFGNLIPFALTSITGGIILSDFFPTKWDKTFKKLGIMNKKGEFPKLLHEFQSDIETTYIFNTPSPFTAYDIMKCQDALEAELHKPLKISITKNFYTEIKVFKEDSLPMLWDKIFKSCGTRNKEGEYPEFYSVEKTQIGNRYIFKLPFGLCVEMFDSIKPLIQSAIHKPVKLSLTPDYKFIIQEYDIHYNKFYTPAYKAREDKALIFPIGITLTENGSQITHIDLTDEPHILVAGINGSGKTNFIKCLLCIMILQDIELKIMDLKMGGDYNIFKKYDNLTLFTKDVNVSKNEIKKIKDLMEERYHLLDKTNSKNYIDYNKKHKENLMKPIVVVIEEYYMLNSKKNNIVDELNEILAKSRACNIKFILALQRPCKDNLEPKLKANLNHTVGFRVNNTYNSGIVLGEGDSRAFTDLHDKGESIILDMYQDTMFKSFYLEDKQIERIISSKCHSYNNISVAKENKAIPIETLKQNKSKKDNVDLIC